MQENLTIVTGGTTGIGAATVSFLRNAGNTVFNFDVNAPPVKDPHFVECDVTSLKNLEKAFAQVLGGGKHLKGLFVNAGIYLARPLELCSEADMNRIIDVNFKGCLFTVKAALPYLLKQKGGAVVLCASDQSLIGKGKSPVYGATKGAVAQLVKSLAVQYAQNGIRVNGVCPGPIDTPLFQDAIQQSLKLSPNQDEKTLKALSASKCPIGRIGQPKEVASAVAYLLSDEASFITGALLSVDGGYTAQ